MKRLSFFIYHLSFGVALLAAVLLSACSSDDVTSNEEPLPEGMGRIHISISTPERADTRAVNANPWEEPDHEWEKLQTFRILICDNNNSVVKIINGTKNDMTAVTDNEHPYAYKRSGEYTVDIEAGTYNIYALANFDDYSDYDVGDTVDPDATVKYANGYSATGTTMFGDANPIPMTGKLPSAVNVIAGSVTDAGTIRVWRVMGKMQFYFTNQTSQKIRIKGIEVEPINQASADGPGIYLFSKDDLTSTANLVPMFAAGATKQGVSATWPLNTSTLQATASVSTGGVFTTAEMTCGNNLVTTDGIITTYDNVYNLQQFKTTGNVTSRDNEAVITFKVTPATGMTFTPKNLSFKACRGGTDGGNFDVEVTSGGTTTTLATGERPRRFNGDNGNNGNHEPPFITNYSYALTNATATTGDVIVKIYLYNLNTKAYAFSDVAISGDVTNNTGSALQEALTLPPKPSGEGKKSAREDVGTVKYELPAASPLELNANGGTHANTPFFFYVNETDATYTTVENQLSVRFKIQRWNGSTWYDDEVRYGFTTHYTDGTTDHDGFNVIRRNDWIHIPVMLRDWTFRVEPLAFVPIAGYPATTLSSDALTTTFSTGGYIILQPFAQKNNDGTWRDFSDPEVTFVSMSWKNSDGNNVSGAGKIFVSPLTYDPDTKRITGELNNNLGAGTYMTTVTVNTKLGPSGSQFDYSFTFNVVLKKTTN